MTNSPYVIAEIGCNHRGDFDLAIEMIEKAKVYCHVNSVKFQKRNPKELLTKDEYNTPHPNPENSYGTTYGLHREALEFSIKQHLELKKFCDEIGLDYCCSVWDLTSTKEIIQIQPKYIKIPSALNLNFKLLKLVVDNFFGKIHLSLGMTTKEEEEKIINFFHKNHRNKDLVLYACVSGYPVPFEDVSLLEISRLVNTYSNGIDSIGFSGHHLGIAVDIAALTLGAKYFERHFTLDRTWKGTDHAASLEPDGLRRLVRDLNNVSKSLTFKRQEILEIEIPQRIKLKRVRNE